MIAYKAFGNGLICRGYQFVIGLNRTDKANCRKDGFHCAENPLDCLTVIRQIIWSRFRQFIWMCSQVQIAYWSG